MLLLKNYPKLTLLSSNKAVVLLSVLRRATSSAFSVTTLCALEMAAESIGLMKHFRNNELTLANTVPQVVACRTSDMLLTYKWTHCVHTVLSGPTAVGVGGTLVHICGRKTRVTICKMTGGEAASRWQTGPPCNCSLIFTMMELSEWTSAKKYQKTNKWSHFYIDEFEACQEIICFASACMKMWEVVMIASDWKWKLCESSFWIHSLWTFFLLL